MCKLLMKKKYLELVIGRFDANIYLSIQILPIVLDYLLVKPQFSGELLLLSVSLKSAYKQLSHSTSEKRIECKQSVPRFTFCTVFYKHVLFTIPCRCSQPIWLRSLRILSFVDILWKVAVVFIYNWLYLSKQHLFSYIV